MRKFEKQIIIVQHYLSTQLLILRKPIAIDLVNFDNWSQLLLLIKPELHMLSISESQLTEAVVGVPEIVFTIESCFTSIILRLNLKETTILYISTMSPTCPLNARAVGPHKVILTCEQNVFYKKN